MRDTEAFLRFSDGGKFSPREQNVVRKLTEATKIIAVLYRKQKNPRYPGANFYPPDASKEEIEKAARRDPAILSPYTLVERRKGKLVAVPYHVKFHRELARIAVLLQEAACMSENKKFSAYLKACADDLLRDNFDRSNILWLQTDRVRIGCMIAPIDRYLDQLFFRKRAYMAWIEILDAQATNELVRLKDLFFSSRRVYLPGSRWVKISEVKLRVVDAVVLSGLVADFTFVGNSIPSSADTALIKKYGTTFTIFKQTLDWRFERWVLPIFQQVFAKEVQERLSVEDLRRAYWQISLLHHASHSLLRFEDAPSRLEELFPYFDELAADLVGIKGCGTLVLKNALTERELEAITLVTICHGLYFYASLQTQPHLNQFVVGAALVIEFLRKGKALEKRADGFHFDAYRTLIALNQLTSIVEYHFSLANHLEAESFLKRFQVRKIFSPFVPYLRSVPKNKGMRLTKRTGGV